MSSTTLYLFAVFLGLRAVVPFQFQPWERWPGIACLVTGCGGLLHQIAS